MELQSNTTEHCVKVCRLTWLGVAVVHSVTIQLEKLLRFWLFLSVTAHGERILTHLQHKGSAMTSPSTSKKQTYWILELIFETLVILMTKMKNTFEKMPYFPAHRWWKTTQICADTIFVLEKQSILWLSQFKGIFLKLTNGLSRSNLK